MHLGLAASELGESASFAGGDAGSARMDDHLSLELEDRSDDEEDLRPLPLEAPVLRCIVDNVLCELSVNNHHALAMARWIEAVDREIDIVTQVRYAAAVRRERRLSARLSVHPTPGHPDRKDRIPRLKPHLFKRSVLLLRAWIRHEGDVA